MKRLDTITINGTHGRKTYFIDERLNELRNVENPHDAYPFDNATDLTLFLFAAVKVRGAKINRGSHEQA